MRRFSIESIALLWDIRLAIFVKFSISEEREICYIQIELGFERKRKIFRIVKYTNVIAILAR